MKWNRCRRKRQQLALLASGTLSKEESAKIETHLVKCAECRNYFAGLKAVATPLTGWEKHFTHIEPRTTVDSLLSQTFTIPAKPAWPLTPITILVESWRQLVLPSRRVWAGLAAVWLGVLVVNHHIASDAPKMTATSLLRSADFIFSFREQEKMMAELILRPDAPAVEPPKPFVPGPRSEARVGFLVV